MLNVNSNYGHDMEIQSKSPEKEKMDTGSKIGGGILYHDSPVGYPRLATNNQNAAARMEVGGTNTLLKQVLTEIQKQTIILESIDRKLSTHK